MTDKKTPKISEPDSAPAEAVTPAPKEPKETGAKSPSAKPAASNIARHAVVGAGDTDTVIYSKARTPRLGESRKSLTVLHVQRRLAEEGFSEAASAPGGRYDSLTASAVSRYQESTGGTPTGILTRAEFTALFKGDHNVTVSIDTHEDNS